MRRLPSILAHVLATTALVACGGQTAGVSEAGSSGSSGSNGSSGSTTGSSGSTTTPPSRPTTPPPPPPPPIDAGADAKTGCEPKLVREGNGCADVFYQPCGVPQGVDPSDGMSAEECKAVCGTNPKIPNQQYWGCGEYMLDDLPGPSFECYTCVEGRRPEGYVEPPTVSTVAGWLAHAADLERVSIDAFQILRRELAHHGAPRALIEAAERAEADEVRHARAVGALAVRAGARLSSAPIHHGEVRDLVAIALENAIEGCVRETYGALVAGWQAEHAEREDIRRVMRSLHRDEAAHAELAWDVHEWIMSRLTREERAQVTRAMSVAIAELHRAAGSPVARALVTELGLPAPAFARMLASGLEERLFAPALAA